MPNALRLKALPTSAPPRITRVTLTCTMYIHQVHKVNEENIVIVCFSVVHFFPLPLIESILDSILLGFQEAM